MPTDRDYYLTKAAELRRIATAVSDEKMADELERLASEFVERAARLNPEPREPKPQP